jgi:SPX domain protein involved in polyphosphate accumulation
MDLRILDYINEAPALKVAEAETDNVESFQRIEDKFLVPRAKASDLMALLERNLDPCYLEPGTEFNLIESVYFDSTNLKFFQEHFANRQTKYKIRLRRYGPNGEWPAAGKGLHIEMKSKTEGVCHKFRLKLNADETATLVQGKAIPLSFKKKDRAQERIGQINGAILTDQLQPQCRVVYKRKAYERNGIRVTIDDQIRAEILRPVSTELRETILNNAFIKKAQAMRSRFTAGDFVVVEVKHSGVMPQWVRDFLTEIGTEPVSFSKYCFSIFSHLTEAK